MAKVFKDSIFLERELESAKIELTLKPDFNLLDGFRMLETHAKGHLSPNDLLDSLINIVGIREVTQNDVYLVFRRYDPRSTGRLNFNQFCQIVTPQSKEYASLLTGRPDFYSTRSIHPSEFFNMETRLEI